MYTIDKQGDRFRILKNGAPIHTPRDNPVETRLSAVADRLVQHLNRFGEDPSDPCSIVAFHYPMIDFFAVEPRELLEGSVVAGLNRNADWTLSCPTAAPEGMMAWMSLFGHPTSQVEAARAWVSKLSFMQLCAVTVIGRNLESVNIPFIVATSLKADDLGEYAKEVSERYPYINSVSVKTMLENYLFYFHAASELGH